MNINHEKYDSCLEASDWRFSASIVGLLRYLDFFQCDYSIDYVKSNDSKIDLNSEYDSDLEEEYEVLLYKSADITEKRYLEFVELTYPEDMHFKVVEDAIKTENNSSELNKFINQKLVANTVMKTYFSKIKYDGSNGNVILSIISKHRQELVRETYRNKDNLYSNFCNRKQLLKEGQAFCRLHGYYIDAGKKGKSLGYNFNLNSIVNQDIAEFDFIPFGFTIGREAFFINDNSSIRNMYQTNNMLKIYVMNDCKERDLNNADVRRTFFKSIIESSDFIDYDVEVIMKSQHQSHFESLYLRKESIDIFNELKDSYKYFCFSYKINDNYYINVQKKVTDSIINKVLVDELIEIFLKEKNKYSFVISNLININLMIKGGYDMTKGMQVAYACAKKVAETIPDNRLDSYRQKLISAIVFKDYDRVCQILLQLSNYSNVTFDFAFSLFDDFETNKEIAYTFINALYKGEKNQGGK